MGGLKTLGRQLSAAPRGLQQSAVKRSTRWLAWRRRLKVRYPPLWSQAVPRTSRLASRRRNAPRFHAALSLRRLNCSVWEPVDATYPALPDLCPGARIRYKAQGRRPELAAGKTLASQASKSKLPRMAPINCNRLRKITLRRPFDSVAAVHLKTASMEATTVKTTMLSQSCRR